MSIERETPQQPDVHRLVKQSDARSAALYPVESRFGASVAALVSQSVRFYVARKEGLAIGCGGYLVGPDRQAELKRVFMAAEARADGIGRHIVSTIEDAAATEGIRILLLETGVASVEALSLYRRLGYIERGPFWSYAADPLSVYMEKRLNRCPPPPSVAAPASP